MIMTSWGELNYITYGHCITARDDPALLEFEIVSHEFIIGLI
jgi:hypothetical protein